jgi:zinc protease
MRTPRDRPDSSTRRLAPVLLALSVAMLPHACARTPAPQSTPAFDIAYERYALDNGLTVVLHRDTSDPIVAVATIVHVGSNREQPGKTGFAHFFEHMSFNDSENAPVGANRRLIPELGGTRNGGTSSDMTIYYEVVPKDAFEKIMWIDSDRLGYMINTVTEAALEREKEVVKNEKRQRVDNVAYGHTEAVVQAALYPEDHPYHWTVIGSLDDLDRASLDDVREFYHQYYGPNNATLVIAGDIEIDATRRLVDYWFGEVPRGPEVRAPKPRPAMLRESRSFAYEDNFATLPELRIVVPTVEQFHEDAYALDALAQLLAGSRATPLYRTVVEEGRLAPDVSVSHSTQELAGKLVIRVRGNAGTDLNAVQHAIDDGLARFEAEGVAPEELARVKVQTERQLYDGIASVLDKAFQLAQYAEFTGDPGYVSTVAARVQAVTAKDVMDVYARYVAGRPAVVTSFVPRGQAQLALAGAVPATVVEEAIAFGAEGEVSQGEEAAYERTVTVADRSEPPLGEPPLLKAPAVWRATLESGLEVYGIEQTEVPLVSFDLSIRGGALLDPQGKAGTASLVAAMMTEGTATRTSEELERALGLLGTRLTVGAGAEEIRLSGTTLARNFEATIALVEELLLEPRWDAAEYERLVRETRTRLTDQEADPVAISAAVFLKLLYGDGHAFGTPAIGTLDTVASIQLDDLQQFFSTNLSPSRAALHVAGDVDQARVVEALGGLGQRWTPGAESLPPQPLPPQTKGQTVYFVDVPGAGQSVLRAGRLVLSAADPDAERLDYANLRLGVGSSGRLMQLLRIEKGYTYGAASQIVKRREVAPFVATTSVRANVTLESMQLLRDELRNYAATFTQGDVDVTKNQIIKSNTRAFESLADKLSMLRQMSLLGLPSDFVERNQEALLAMTRGDFRTLIETYLDESQMIYVVVGDAATQRERLSALGYGQPVLLDIHGRPVH